MGKAGKLIRYEIRFAIGIILITLMLASNANAATTHTVGTNGCDFTSIQACIDDVNTVNGDTIEVQSGKYYENVIVNKQLTLRGIGMPVVNAGGILSAITLTADGITLEGFTATNSAFFYLTHIDYEAGIKVNSNNNIIRNNIASDNNGMGILVEGPYYSNIIENNILNGNTDGILTFGHSTTIMDNSINNNRISGIFLDGASNNVIRDNIVTGSENGLGFEFANDNIIEGNTIKNNVIGLANICGDFTGNRITHNIIRDNSMRSIHLDWDGYNNLIYNNDLDSVYSYSNNNWDDGIGLGNYYSVFDEPSEGCYDSDGDGICDSSYSIPGSSDVDMYPLVLWNSNTNQAEHVPEFPTIALPIISMIGLMSLFQRRRGK